MINDTLEKIEKIINSAVNMDDTKKKNLLSLVENLKIEIGKLPESDSENAQTIANFIKASTHEAVKENRDDELTTLSIQGLSLSAKKFEASHPDLVLAINSVCNFLSNLGI